MSLSRHEEQLLARAGKAIGQAEQWYRKAAEAGYSRSASNLGRVLFERGELAGAERFLLDERGNHSDAERWYRRAAEAGNAAAARNLAILLRDRGDARGADE